MLITIIIGIYRILACLMIASPIAINILLNGSIVMSFIYMPLLCILLSIFSIYIDKKLLDALLNIKLIKIKKINNEEQKSTNISPLY